MNRWGKVRHLRQEPLAKRQIVRIDAGTLALPGSARRRALLINLAKGHARYAKSSRVEACRRKFRKSLNVTGRAFEARKTRVRNPIPGAAYTATTRANKASGPGRPKPPSSEM